MLEGRGGEGSLEAGLVPTSSGDVLTRRQLRLAGALSAAAVLAFLWAASRIPPFPAFPPAALSERIVRLTPGGIATFFIDALKHNAMRLLTLGTVAAFFALFASAPRLTSFGHRVRPVLAGAFVTAIAVAADLTAPMFREPVASVAMAFVVGIMYGTSLRWLLETSVEAPADPSRRRAMIAIGTAAAGFAVAGTLLGRLGKRLLGPNTAVLLRAADEPAASVERAAFHEIPGLSPEVTSVADHYVVDIDLLDPVVEAAGWQLTVAGRVGRPLALSYEELQAQYRLVEQLSVLTCVSNEIGGDLVGSARWTGVRLADVLADAKPMSGVIDVVFRCADGYSSSLPLEAANNPSVLLALGMNGQTLTWEHGFPCRVRAPSVYGVKNAKWIERIELVDRDYADYWTVRGWSDAAVVRTSSRIDTVGGPENRAGRPTWIAGVAWAGARGISRVEVSLDGGRTWQEAELREPLSSLAWTQWAYRWTPEALGAYRILCRAVDGRGQMQDRAPRQPHPSGATGYHEVTAEVA